MDSLLVLGATDEKVAAFLNKIGCALVQVTEPQDLLPALGRGIFDLVIVDADFGLSGRHVCEFLNAHGALKQVPILYLAGNAEEEKELQLLAFDRFSVLCKPFKPGALVGKITTQLRLRKIAGSDADRATLGEVNATLRDLNARFERELKEAQLIQQSLVPQALPSDARYEIAVSYEPLEEVGGDWYFVRQVSGERLSVQIADVTGHGLSAAFVGSITKLALMAADCDEPHDLLTKMNRLMAPNVPAGSFVTMFSYLYDPATGNLTYARAGHPPGLLMHRAEKRVEQLKSEGFAIGFFEDSEYAAESAALAPGDLLVIYTDAIPESQNPEGETYDYARLEKLLAESDPHAGADTILLQILNDFDAFRGRAELKDDVTVIVLKRNV